MAPGDATNFVASPRMAAGWAMTQLPRSAEVVIIGGGLIGLSSAYYLARAGCRDVVLLERKWLGSGTSAHCSGGIRAQFSTEINIRLSQESLKTFENFEAEFDVDPEFRRTGYLFLATTPDEEGLFRRNVELQQRFKVPVELIGPEVAKRIVPPLNVEDVRVAAYSASDGIADPHSVLQAFARASRRLGVKILEETEVMSIGRHSQRVESVVTTVGDIAPGILVVAAGPWSGQLGKMLDVEIPVYPQRRQAFMSGPVAGFPPVMPLTIDFNWGFSIRREGPGILMHLGNRKDPPAFVDSPDWEFFWSCSERIAQRVPALAEAEIVKAYACAYEMTPDVHPIISRVKDTENVLVAAGFSGHGFMHSPVAGQLVADLVMKGGTDLLDIRPLRLDRFKEGDLHREAAFIG